MSMDDGEQNSTEEFGFLVERSGHGWQVASNDGGGTMAYTLDEVREFMQAKVADWIGDMYEEGEDGD